jgi:hypothetical protein
MKLILDCHIYLEGKKVKLIVNEFTKYPLYGGINLC